MFRTRIPRKRIFFVIYLILANVALFTICSFTTEAVQNDTQDGVPWTIYYSPGIRFGTEGRTLFINDFIIPIYRDDNRILFGNVKYTPSDIDSWEVNLGLGYRQSILHDNAILGINSFYDRCKTPRGSNFEAFGLGAEIMAEVPIKDHNIGLTGRVNGYFPLSD
jgi:hypothetical protein